MPLTEQKKERYAKLIEKCPRFELKGKNNLYTSANGHMFSMFNKDGDFGIRFSKEKQDHYIKELGTGHLISYGATMRGYVRMPEHLWDDLDTLANYMNEGYDFVMSLKPK